MLRVPRRGRADRDPRPPPGDAPAPDGRTARPGDRPALRRGPGRGLHPGDPWSPQPGHPPRARPRGGLARRGGRVRELRAERHRAHLPARPPDQGRSLLLLLAVDLAPGRFGGLHAGGGGQSRRAAGAQAHRGPGHHLRRTGAGRAARRRLPGHARRAAPRAPGGPGRRQGRVAAGGRSALRRYAGLPRRAGVHRGRPGDVHDPGGRPAVGEGPFGLDDQAAPARDVLGRTDRDAFGDERGRRRLHHVQRGRVPGRRGDRLPPDLGKRIPRTAG